MGERENVVTLSRLHLVVITLLNVTQGEGWRINPFKTYWFLGTEQ